MSRIYVLITVLLLFSPVLLVGGGSFEVEREDGLVGDERDVVGWRGMGGGSIDYDPGDTDSSASLGKRFVMGLGWVDIISVTFRLHNESRSVGLCYGVPVGSSVVVEPVPVRSKANRAVSLSLGSDSSFDSKNILQTKSVFDFYDYNVVVPALEYRHIYSSVNGSLEEDAGLEADTGLEEKKEEKEEPVLLESRLVGNTTKTFVFGVASPLGVEKDLGVWVFGSFGGGSGSSGDPYEIEDVSQLQNMSGFLSSSFILANDIDASTTASWNGGDGFVPVGNVSAPFTGGFYGDNYTISGLYIDRGDEDFVGLFGNVYGGTVGVVHLDSLNVTGKNYAGGLVGLMDDTVVHNVSVHGVVVGGVGVGGLVGVAEGDSSVAQSKAGNDTVGVGDVGGLVGRVEGGTISDCYTWGVVRSNRTAGGLVGRVKGGLVRRCYTSANTTNMTGGVTPSVYEQDFDLEVAGAVPDGWTDTSPTRPATVFEVHTGLFVSSPHSLYLEPPTSGALTPQRGRDIVANTEDTFYLDWRVKDAANINAFIFQSTTGNGDGAQFSAQIYIMDNKFRYYDTALRDTGTAAASNTWYKMKIVFDWANYKYDWYVWNSGTSTWDTIKAATPFRNNVQYIRSIHTAVNNVAGNGLYLDNLQLGETQGAFVGMDTAGTYTHNKYDNTTAQQTSDKGATGYNTTTMYDNTTYSDWSIAEMFPHTDEVWWINNNTDYPRLWWEEKIMFFVLNVDTPFPNGAGVDFYFYAWVVDSDDRIWYNATTTSVWQNATNGVFNEVVVGKYNVSAEYDGMTSNIVEVTVTPSSVDTVEIWASTNTIVVGGDIHFQAWANDSHGNTITDTLTDFVWQNATNGVFNEVVVGKYNVSAEYDGMTSSTWEMTTTPPLGRVWNINTGNEYGTIQTAITSVTTLDGHTIHAWAGIYTENATITKELEIYGNNTNTIVSGSLTIQSHNTTIRNLVVTGGNILGVGIDVNGNNTLITNTHIHTLDYPITSYNTPTDSLTITQNTIQGAILSIYLLNTNNTLIYDNTINPVGTTDTIDADTCTNTTIYNNNITGRDMVLTGVENTTVHNNNFNNNREIYVESSTDTTIYNNTFLSTPLYAKETNRLYLFHNTFSDTTTAIRIHDCNNTIVDGNDVRNSTNGVLIQREKHSLPGYNTIRHNYLFNNTRGIHVFARHTTIHNNTISNNINGIVINGLSHTYYMPQYNKIYHNVFLRNEYHASDDGVLNLWNLSYPQGGNYWSDHQCPDDYSGQYQDIPGGDGVVDDMRHITGSASAKDYYPLIHPEPIAPPTPPSTTAPFEFQLPIGQNCFIVLFILAFLAAFGGMLGGRDREDGTPDNEKRRWHKDD